MVRCWLNKRIDSSYESADQRKSVRLFIVIFFAGFRDGCSAGRGVCRPRASQAPSLIRDLRREADPCGQIRFWRADAGHETPADVAIRGASRFADATERKAPYRAILAPGPPSCSVVCTSGINVTKE